MKPSFFRIWIFVLILAACSPAERRAKPGFYYWKTSFALSPAERRCLDETGCKHLYVKFLDIGISPESGRIAPLAMLNPADTSGLSGRTVIPCVFITNEVFRRIKPEETTWLAAKIVDAVTRIGSRFPGFTGLDGRIAAPEIQIDCDWSAGTRAAYFLFLEKLKAALPAPLRLSATIRLHQYKFPGQTGVPPADRGMLMFYNTGDIDDPNEQNSILQPADVQKFLQGAPPEYALPLDVVLPLFSWALVYREESLWKIIPGLQNADLADTARFAAGKQPGRFTVKKGTFLNGYYLRPDDLIRFETITPDLLRQSAGLARQADLARDPVIAFFELNESELRDFSPQLLNSVWQSFGQQP